MPENKYIPPESNLIKADESLAPEYFVVGKLKFILMSFGTFGLYELYWCYKNWKHIKEKEGSKIMPFWRAFFAPLWGFSLAATINSHAEENNIPTFFSSGLIGFLYLITSVIWQLPDPYWLISMFSFVWLMPLLTTTEKLNEKLASGTATNYRFWWANYITIFLGIPFFALSVYATFFPEY